jgi:3-oxoacyl-[acyl-carrier protein] reductase
VRSLPNSAKTKVRVNAVGPGLIETPLNAQARANNPDIAPFGGAHAVRPHWPPEDVIGPASFLASDLAAYVTRTIIMADGGYRTVKGRT